MSEPDLNSVDAVALGLLNVLKRGTTLEITDSTTEFYISTEILDTDPDGAGGVRLVLAGTVDEGALHVSPAALATAARDDDAYEFGCGALHVRTGAEGEPAVGPGGFFTENPELLAEHRAAVDRREAARDAKRAEQEGR
jgi:hypothetical protein